VNLLIPKNQLEFKVKGWDLNSKTKQYEKFVRNPTKDELDKWHYLPRLTGYNRMGYQTVRIEFSIPKLLFFNNVDEVKQNDFPLVVDALQKRLNAMGVIANKEVLENATISAIHFSKNIQLNNGFTTSYIISELNKVDMIKCFDFAKTRYVNNGESLYAHSTSYQFVIYDKIADLKKNNKRAIDKDQPIHQRSLFTDIKDKPIEILRFEIRLGNKQKIDRFMERLDCQKNLVFKDIFNFGISQKVITFYWNKLIKERSLGLFCLPFTMKDALRTILASNRMKPKQGIYLIGLLTLARDEGGIRALRSLLSKKTHQRTWYRFVQDIKIANELITQNKFRDWVVYIDEKLAEFEAYKYKKTENGLSTLQDLPCKEL